MANKLLCAIFFLTSIFIEYGQCNMDEEFKTMILERIQLQDEKNQQQDEKILNLETENSILASKLELYQTQFQASLNAAETSLEEYIETADNINEKQHQEHIHQIKHPILNLRILKKKSRNLLVVLICSYNIFLFENQNNADITVIFLGTSVL